MKYTATIRNSEQANDIEVESNGVQKKVFIPVRTGRRGSSVNGGELLFLALATCFCNDLYREGARRKINIVSVEVTVTGNFEKEGDAGTNIRYSAKVQADATAGEIAELIRDVDRIAEIHKTLRQGVGVTLDNG